MKTAIVTGGTSGLGLAAAQRLAEKGLRVYALSRHGAPVPGVTSLACDFSDAGAVECTTPEEARRLFNVDFFGVVNVNHAVLPRMRRAGGGRIVHVSSVAAPVAIPFQAYYSAAKAAINAYSSALRCEVAPFGIDVCAVMPGDLKTGFTAAREKNVRGDTEYGGRISRSVSRMEHDEQTGMPPEKAAAFLCRVALRRRTKPLYAIGPQYSAAVLLSRLLPCRLVSWIVSRLYAA